MTLEIMRAIIMFSDSYLGSAFFKIFVKKKNHIFPFRKEEVRKTYCKIFT